jgi:hypothetical protein
MVIIKQINQTEIYPYFFLRDYYGDAGLRKPFIPEFHEVIGNKFENPELLE